MTKILVADDSSDGREVLRDFLEAWGFEVMEACDGREALAKVETSTPDLVLIDIQMPRMDGYTVLEHLRRNPHLAHLPVVAVTAFAMRGDRERAEAHGFDAYLTKPVNFQDLRAKVTGLLQGRAA